MKESKIKGYYLHTGKNGVDIINSFEDIENDIYAEITEDLKVYYYDNGERSSFPINNYRYATDLSLENEDLKKWLDNWYNIWLNQED